MRQFDYFGFITKQTTWKKWVVFCLLFVVLNMYFSLYTNPTFEQISGGLSILDATQGYSVEQAEKLLTTLPQKGIQFYVYYFFSVDLVFPAIYTVFFTLTLSALFSQIISPKHYLRYVLLLPPIMAFADYMENVGIVFMMSLLPGFSTTIGGIVSMFSVMKWRLGAIISLSILLSAIVVLLKFMRGKIRKTTNTTRA